jgi:hypothetical protein
VHDRADPDRLLELIGASWTTQVIRTATELGVVDALAAGPRRVGDLAEELAVDVEALGRLLRALCSIELCEPVGDAVGLTATGTLLVAGDGSLGPWARWWGGPVWQEWASLPDAIRTGRAVRQGDGFADAGHAERAELFDAAMAGLSALEAPAIAEALGLHGHEVVVDLGGGTGVLLRAVLERHPQARGVLVDRPAAAAAARRAIGAAGLGDRCEVLVGDLFAEPPSGGDAYVLKNVLHDWEDGDARRILQACAAGMGPGARLLVVERLGPETLDSSPGHRGAARMDLHMLVAQGGRERTEPEHRQLLGSAGFEVVDVRPAGGTLAVIDATAGGRTAQRGD